MIPPIWFIELTRIDDANAKRQSNSTASSVNFDIDYTMIDDLVSNDSLIKNFQLHVSLKFDSIFFINYNLKQ